MRHKSTELSESDVREALELPRDFGYSGDLDLGNTWALGPVIRTRDSSLLEESNADALEAALAAATKAKEVESDSWEVTHSSHWAVGWVDHLSYQVIDAQGNPTRMARWLKRWFEALADYPVADEEDVSRREYEATIENIESEGRRMLRDDVPKDWAEQVFSWFWDNDQAAVESHDGGGGYPNDAQLREALADLGFLEPEEN